MSEYIPLILGVLSLLFAMYYAIWSRRNDTRLGHTRPFILVNAIMTIVMAGIHGEMVAGTTHNWFGIFFVMGTCLIFSNMIDIIRHRNL